MSNQKYFDVPFGFSGDVTAIPDPLQAGGTVSFTEGWNFNYQRNLATDPAALPIDRSTMNWLLLQITTAIQALQKETIPEWITAAQNGGVAISYGLGSEILWSASGNAPFTKFTSLVTNNVATPSVGDPLGATTGWQIACDPIATSAQAATGTNNASIMTPLLVAQQTALRALLAGSTTQVFNVGPATAPTHAPQLQQMTGRLLNIQTFNTAGTSVYVPTTGTTKCKVTAIGGGASGGGAAATGVAQCSVGGGGGAGTVEIGLFAVATLTGQTITVAAGGATSSAAGNTGGTTSIGSAITATGGTGGAVGVATAVGTVSIGGSGGTSGTGGNISGGAGGAGGIGSVPATGNGASGAGGNSSISGGAVSQSGNGNGNQGAAAGAGGSGGINSSASQGAKASGSGAAGIVIIEEYA